MREEKKTSKARFSNKTCEHLLFSQNYYIKLIGILTQKRFKAHCFCLIETQIFIISIGSTRIIQRNLTAFILLVGDLFQKKHIQDVIFFFLAPPSVSLKRHIIGFVLFDQNIDLECDGLRKKEIASTLL